ncbi:SDR family NAD(P)-dependent oxidoreductase [Phycicoccus sonneratiae]|uniref:SDR family oxidoreductase n=1 Tax=Phycicoccus sonneratiae TaxID=2807628 RepID=A0ABS2CRR5_9MICO|nr:SDR family oxidoreductase [Phycicoccus sonneraticus]MBM6402577.1 SDR family oxidoreductase [Phycicoccus sonneraticus]
MTALVTGASGGLGRAVAVALAAAGHDVGVHYRGDADGADATAAEVVAAGRRAVTLHADLATDDPAACDRVCADLLAAGEEALGVPDVVVLNAFPQHHVAWDELDAAAWDDYHRGGLRPTAVLLRQAAARMPVGGSVVVVGSIEGSRPMPTHTPYAVAKAALEHLVRAAAQELGPRGVRVVGVAPGLVARDGLEEAWPEGVARYRAAAALGRPVTPEEVAATVAFLASGDASGITGTTVTVDAGWSAAPGW